MNILPTPPRVAGLALGFIVATSLAVAAGKKNPTSKLYVADLQGQAQIDTGDLIEDLSEKSVHNAQGTVIETKDASTNAMVFSNGTGIFFDQDTRMEVKRFSQEPFSPNRTDLETEPSISQSVSHIPRGTVGLCTPKLVAGSTMVYSTPNANVNIRQYVKALHNGKNEFLGIVLNGLSPRRIEYYSNYRYYRSYKKYYGAEA